MGGRFLKSGAVSVNNLTRWDGIEWCPVDGGIGANYAAHALAEFQGHLYVGGSFGRNGSPPGLNLARWDGERWHEVGGGVSRLEVQPGPFPITNEIGTVQALVTTEHGLYVGGQFDRAGSIEAHSIALWDGAKWSALGAGLKRNIQASPWKPANHWGSVGALAASGSNVFAGGEFHFADDRPSTNIACWNGREWKPLSSGVSDYGYVGALAVRGSELYAGGVFHQIGGVRANMIARWDGEAWHPFGSGLGGNGGSALAVRGDSLFVGGDFGLAGGKPANNMARWHWPRTLNVTVEDGGLKLDWPAVETNAVLESASNLSAGDWQRVALEPVLEDGRRVVRELAPLASRFYRLRYP